MDRLNRFFDALSLSGAIIMIFFTLTVVGIWKNNEKVWTTFGTALTTFVSGKGIGKREANKTDTTNITSTGV